MEMFHLCICSREEVPAPSWWLQKYPESANLNSIIFYTCMCVVILHPDISKSQKFGFTAFLDLSVTRVVMWKEKRR